MTTKTLTTNASLYDCNGYLVMSGITVQHCTGDANRCDTIISGNTEHRADDCVIRDGEITGLGGWTLTWDAANEPTAKLILECTRSQKGSYVRAAAGRKLVVWCLEQLDAAASPRRLYRYNSPDWGDNVLATADDYRSQAEMFGLSVQIEERADGIYIDGELVGHAI